MTTISLKVPKSTNAKLTATARCRGTTKSAVMREALDHYLSDGDRPLPGSFLEAAKEFIGKYSVGPPDLATNKKYMEGFGQ